jgi:hypothetical protein
VIVAGLATSLVAAIVLVPAVVKASDARRPQLGGDAVGFTATPALDWSAAKQNLAPFTNCAGKPVDDCTVVHGTTGPHLLLIGDSHAGTLIPTFAAIARRNHATLSVSVHGGCPWQQDLYAIPINVNGTKLSTSDCEKLKRDFYDRVLPELHPDVIFTMNVDHEDPHALPYLGPDGKPIGSKTARAVRWMRQTTTASLAKLRASGSKVVLLEPIPVAPFNPLDCLSGSKYVEDCRYVANAAPESLETDYRELAEKDPDVVDVDLDRLVCPFLPICDPIVDGRIVKWDGTHLTARYAEAIAPRLDDYLRQSGILPN